MTVLAPHRPAPAPAPTADKLSSFQQAQIETHQGLVRSLALKVAVTLPAAVELDDLIGYGQIGLVQAAQGFNPAVGVAFATYAHYRVRGAIYDGLGKMAWFGGARAAELRADRAANEALRERAERRPPTRPTPARDARGRDADDRDDDRDDDQNEVDGDAADGPDGGRDAAWLGTTGRSLAAVFLLSQTGSTGGAGRPDPVDPGVAPEEAAGAAEAFARLRTLVDELPEDAATLIRGVYFEGLSLKDAGARIGISRGWASRLHAKALARLGREIRRLGL